MPDYGPHHGVLSNGDLPTISYLDWYIPRLREQRKHNLSFSGMQYDWDLASLIDDSIQDIHRHHIPNFSDPETLVAQREGIDVEKILCTHGATQALQIALTAVLKENRCVAVESPAYAPVSQTPLLLNCKTIPVQRKPPVTGLGHWRIDREQWLEALQESAVLMVTPQLNPSGWDYHEEDRDWIVETCRELGVWIIADEVYIDYSRGSEDHIAFHTLGEHCISINSLTKIYGLGPIRFGWIIASEKTISEARKAFLTTQGMISSPTVRIANAIFPHLDLAIDKINEYREINLPILREVLAKHCITWNEPKYGVFGAIELPNGVDAIEFVDGVCKELDLLATPGSMFSQETSNWLRIAWSIEPSIFGEAVSALSDALERIK